MGKLAVSIGAAALGFGAWTTAHGYAALADVTFTWAGGGNGGSTILPGRHIAWTSNGVNTLANVDNTTYFTAEAGSNSVTYYNPDFAQALDYGQAGLEQCLTPLPLYETIALRKYACRQFDTEGEETPFYQSVPVTDVGPAPAATGQLLVTGTSITGTLTVIQTTDEPTGATTTIINGVRISNSTGNGSDGYNVRTADGSPFGNAWYGVTQTMTLTVNLTGTFNATNWEITGGTVAFADPNFACQQGGFGGDARGTLCSLSTTGGGISAVGSNLTWGMDTDGAGTGPTAITPVEVRNAGGDAQVSTLSGVLASLAVDVGGNISTNAGEFRSASGSAGGNCFTSIRWDGTKISCGTLVAGPLAITGTARPVPSYAADAFIDQTGVARNTQIESNLVVIQGLGNGVAISVTGGEYSIDNGAYTAAAGTIDDGQLVKVRQTSSANFATAVDTVLTVGAVSDTFTTTTLAQDTTPDAFSFTDVNNVALNTVQTSNTVTIAGINDAAAVSVTGGEYSVNGGAFMAAAGTVNNGDTVAVRHTSSASLVASVNTTLTVGGVADTFTSTTTAVDTIPDPFSFIDVTDVPLNVIQVSNAVTISGLTALAQISVVGGEYSVDCQSSGYTAVAGTIAAGQTVCVRHRTAPGYGGTTSTTLTIGGVSDTFSSTTAGGPLPGNVTTYDVYGKMAKLTNVCFNIAVSLTSNDCSYAKTRDPTGNWRGPIEGSSFYPIGSPGDSISYVPTPNDGKYAMPLSGTLTIDDNGTPADGRDDLISGTFVFGAAAFNASTGNGDRAVERWSSWTHTMAPTQVDAAESQPGGGFRYRIGSRGEPTPAPLFVLGNPADTFPSENAKGVLDAPPIWDSSGATLTPSSARVGIERSRGFGLGGTGNVGATTTAVFAGYSCEDNPGDSDCAGLSEAQTSSPSLFGPNRNGIDPFSAPFATTQLDPDSVPLTAGFSNVVLLLTTDGNGGISAADAYWTREYIIRNGPDLSGDEPGVYKINNSWGGGRFSFSTDPPPTAPTAVDDIATALSGVTTAIAVLGNDELGSPEPHTLTIEVPPANGQAVAGTGVINYTPNAGFSGTDSFRYRLTDGDGDFSTATVSVTVPDAIPMAADFFYQTFFGNPTPPFAVLEYPTLLGNGTAADHALAFTDQGELGFCSLVGGDRIRYQPIAGRGDGPDSCTYRITDLDGDADEGMIYVYVYANPTAPDLARDDFAATPTAQSVVIDVLTNDAGFSDPVTVGLFTVPLHGNVTVTGSPGPRSGIVLTYTPAPGFEGEDYFDYAVDDGNQADVARVTVRVAQDLGPDGDGVTQSADNCTAVYNPDQRDTNGDGFGNLCDGDLDNNGFVNFADLGLFRQQFGSPGPDADFNGNGVVNFADLGIFRGLFGKPPGPSGVQP